MDGRAPVWTHGVFWEGNETYALVAQGEARDGDTARHETSQCEGSTIPPTSRARQASW